MTDPSSLRGVAVPYYADDWITVLAGDAAEQLATLPDRSIHCVITSPPFFGLRDYGVAGQIGLEPTPQEHIAALLRVFAEVWRVLRDDGTLWLEYGDCYATGAGKVGDRPGGGEQGDRWRDIAPMTPANRMPLPGLKPKDLCGMPWRVAFALQEQGWYLRSDIIWARPNPMPESVTDRPTKSHSYLFLLAKRPRYFWDAEAVREPSIGVLARDLDGGPQRLPDGSNANEGRSYRSKKPDGWDTGEGGHGTIHRDGREAGEPSEIRSGRNLRSVWTIPTQPYPGAHFASFPEKLVEPCILAGTSAKGVCPECGAPWVRETKVTYVKGYRSGHLGFRAKGDASGMTDMSELPALDKHVETTGWHPTCDHDADPIPATVLDPFAGTGTVGLVAQRLSRKATLIDLNPEYLKQCLVRNAQSPLGLETA